MCTKICNNQASKPIPKVKESEHGVFHVRSCSKGNATVFINTTLNFTNCTKEQASLPLHGIYGKGHWLFIQEISSQKFATKLKRKNHKTKQLQSKVDRLKTHIPWPFLTDAHHHPRSEQGTNKACREEKKEYPRDGQSKNSVTKSPRRHCFVNIQIWSNNGLATY